MQVAPAAVAVVEASSGSASAGLSLGVELSNMPLTAGQLKVVLFNDNDYYLFTETQHF